MYIGHAYYFDPLGLLRISKANLLGTIYIHTHPLNADNYAYFFAMVFGVCCQQCPLTDARDYGDYPYCNALGLDEGPDPYAKTIYR